MKVVILAGGYGTRISEHSQWRPKPMIPVGDYPILWHIMKIYSAYGYTDFILCTGYKSAVIKDYFLNYYLYQSDVTVDLGKGNELTVHRYSAESWRVTMAETGMDTMTGGRVRRIRRFVGNEPFMLTYGDGLADIDLHALVRFHLAHGKLATVTAVQPQGRFGALTMHGDGRVEQFREKLSGDGAWVNGGFFVLQPEVFDYIDGDASVFEREPLERLAADGELMAYRHHGFWQPMDTLRDHKYLESLWKSGKAPWKVWSESS